MSTSEKKEGEEARRKTEKRRLELIQEQKDLAKLKALSVGRDAILRNKIHAAFRAIKPCSHSSFSSFPPS